LIKIVYFAELLLAFDIQNIQIALAQKEESCLISRGLERTFSIVWKNELKRFHCMETHKTEKIEK